MQNLNDDDRSDRSDSSDSTFIKTLILCIIKVLYNGINGFDSIIISIFLGFSSLHIRPSVFIVH